MPLTKGQKKYFAIKDVLTRAEKELIQFYELEWHLMHRVPSIEAVTKHLKKRNPKVTQISVNYYLTRPKVIKGLKDRGIPWREHSQSELSATQVAAAVTVMNLVDTRSTEDKLDQLGILPATYYAWLNDPQFKNLVDNLANQNLTNIRPTAIAEFTKKINQGDWNAIKFWLETTGELKSSEVPNSEILLRMIIEIIQKHVKSPEVILAIAEDIKLAAANKTLEFSVESSVESSQPALTSTVEAEVIETDEELIRAKRLLGFGV